MKTQVFDVKMGRSVIIMTLVIIIVLIGMGVSLAIGKEITAVCLYSFVTLLVIVLSYIYKPQKIELGEQSFTLYRVVGKLRFNYADIERVEPCRINSLKTIRLFGIGGFGSITGLYCNAEIGRFRAYIGDSKQTFLVVMKDDKKYVFSCEDREAAVEAISERILNNE